MTVWSQANAQEVQEPRRSESIMKEILDLVSEPSGSKELSGNLSKSKPRVGMRSWTTVHDLTQRKLTQETTPMIDD